MKFLIFLGLVAYVHGQVQDLCAAATGGPLIFADDPAACDAYLWCNYNSDSILVSVHQQSCPQGSNFLDGACDFQHTCAAPKCQFNQGSTRVAVHTDTTCRDYITCDDDAINDDIVMSCTAPGVFNRNFGSCTVESIAPCSGGGSGGGGAVSCPPDENGLVNDPSGCGTHRLCRNGVLSYPIECPNDLHFNTNGNFCDFPENLDPPCVDTSKTTHINIPQAPLRNVAYGRLKMMLNKK